MIPLKLLLLLATCAGAEKLMHIKGKIALVTGGAQGIGYAIIEELLRSGIRGVTLVDLNVVKGKTSARALNSRYGNGTVIYIPADVTNETQFEDAVKISLYHWKSLDIVVNNAGTANEHNWKVTINTNIISVLQGTFLGFRYMSKSKGGKGGVIINISSVSALDTEYYFSPIYSASKSFVLGLGRALGHQVYFDYNDVRIVTACPGLTSTELVGLDNIKTKISTVLVPNLPDIAVKEIGSKRTQSSLNLGYGIRMLIEVGDNGSVWVIENDEPPYQIDFPDRKAMRKNHF